MSLNNIDVEIDFRKAIAYSFLLLKYRPRSKAEIIYRLKNKGLQSPLINKVIEYLQHYNYINDEEFCRFFVSSYLERGWGSRRIELKLENLGISQELRDKFIKDTKPKRKEKIHEIIKKRLNQYDGKKNIYQRMVRYLTQRGFDYEDIIEELQKFNLPEFKQ